MQAYSRGFAYVYNERWAVYAKQIAPYILDFYNSTSQGKSRQPILDLCCGAGHLLAIILENGFDAVGIDLSPEMLKYAEQNTESYLSSGKVELINADVSNFTIDKKFGLVVSAYDSLNHLNDENALLSCFQAAHTVCDGYFIFDLNTRKGLNRWNNINVDESSDDFFIVTRGIFDQASDKAWTKISGFYRNSDGTYNRFEETVFNTVFSMKRVGQLLKEAGWDKFHFATLKDLSNPIDDPEDLGRAYFVASK